METRKISIRRLKRLAAGLPATSLLREALLTDSDELEVGELLGRLPLWLLLLRQEAPPTGPASGEGPHAPLGPDGHGGGEDRLRGVPCAGAEGGSPGLGGGGRLSVEKAWKELLSIIRGRGKSS